MKRIVVLAAALSLTLCAVAPAATPRPGTFKAARGQIQRGYDLSFMVDRGGKRISRVVAHVREWCDGTPTSSRATIRSRATWLISGGRFSARRKETSDDVTVFTTLRGRFITPTTATGTIRQETVVAGSVCDTFTLKFTARRR